MTVTIVDREAWEVIFRSTSKLHRLRVREGDASYRVETEDGELLATTPDPVLAHLIQSSVHLLYHLGRLSESLVPPELKSSMDGEVIAKAIAERHGPAVAKRWVKAGMAHARTGAGMAEGAAMLLDSKEGLN